MWPPRHTRFCTKSAHSPCPDAHRRKSSSGLFIAAITSYRETIFEVGPRCILRFLQKFACKHHRKTRCKLSPYDWCKMFTFHCLFSVSCKFSCKFPCKYCKPRCKPGSLMKSFTRSQNRSCSSENCTLPQNRQ